MDRTRLTLLTVDEIAAADRFAIERGTPGIVLMERAGLAVAEAVLRQPELRSPGPVMIACGPGNNGGDGLVAARILREHGVAVQVGLLGDPAALSGDAALAWQRFAAPAMPLADAIETSEVGLFVDAIFGAGLNRAPSGEAALAIERMNSLRRPIIAIDVPSGLDGNTGLAPGAVVAASETVTFFRLKPGHLLLPGRDLCGRVECADIGIPAEALDRIGSEAFGNGPELWADAFPRHGSASHKFSRGAVAVLAGGVAGVGAPRLAARAAMRIGAGLATIHCAPSALSAHAARGPDALMQRPLADAEGLSEILADQRLGAVVAGPALGMNARAQALVAALQASRTPTVFDADALSLIARFGAGAAGLAGRPGVTVMTPHEGEFVRLFGSVDEVTRHASKLERARAAARHSGSIIVYKGADTVIAAPDGRAAINDTGSAALATAGAGDVLAGMIGGLLAQRMPAFEAAAAAVWLHGRAGDAIGFGLIADDLPEALPSLLRELHSANRP